MMRWFCILFGVLLLSSCEKEVTILDNTTFDLSVNRDEFSDTIYWIDKINVVSTNDSVIDRAMFKLEDEFGNTLFEDRWQNARNYSFGLEQRRKYTLEASLYLNPGNTLVSEEIEIDNNDYPDGFKINGIEINSSVLNNDGTYYVSNVHGTIVTIYHTPDALFTSDNYNVDLATVFYQKQFSPKKVSYNFNNFELPVRAIDDVWRQYEIQVGFPIVVGASGTTVVNDRKVIFYVDLEELVKNGNSSAGITLFYNSDDSTEGGIYTGTMEFEWIYEN